MYISMTSLLWIIPCSVVVGAVIGIMLIALVTANRDMDLYEKTTFDETNEDDKWTL